MKVIPFPQKKHIKVEPQRHLNDHLMDVTERTLNHIVNDISETCHNGQDLREQLIFVLEKLADVAVDLKSAPGRPGLKSC